MVFLKLRYKKDQIFKYRCTIWLTRCAPPACCPYLPRRGEGGGGCLPLIWGVRIPACTGADTPPPVVGMETPSGVNLETPPARPLNFPLGWAWRPARHAGIPHPQPPNPPSLTNRMTEREVYKHNFRKFCLRAVIYLMSKTMGSDIEGSKGALDTCAPSIQMFSISYSFWDKMAQIKRLTYSPWGLAHPPPHLKNSVSALVR